MRSFHLPRRSRCVSLSPSGKWENSFRAHICYFPPHVANRIALQRISSFGDEFMHFWHLILMYAHNRWPTLERKVKMTIIAHSHRARNLADFAIIAVAQWLAHFCLRLYELPAVAFVKCSSKRDMISWGFPNSIRDNNAYGFVFNLPHPSEGQWDQQFGFLMFNW